MKLSVPSWLLPVCQLETRLRRLFSASFAIGRDSSARRIRWRSIFRKEEAYVVNRQLVRAQRSIDLFPRLSFVLWDEAFFHLNDTDWGARTGFDQNRAFGGLGFKRTPDAKGRVEFGYLNQTLDIPSGNDRTHHLLSVNFYF